LLERTEESERDEGDLHLARCLEIARELDMPGLVTRAEALRRPADRVEAAVAPVVFTLDREGDVWVVARPSRSFRLKDTRGLQMLALLVKNPGREVHALALGGGGDPGDLGDAGDVLDADAMSAYRERLEDLREPRSKRSGWGVPMGVSKARAEIEMLAQQLAQGVGLAAGRARPGSIRRARATNVQRRIKDAIGRIEKHDAELDVTSAGPCAPERSCVFDPAKKSK